MSPWGFWLGVEAAGTGGGFWGTGGVGLAAGGIKPPDDLLGVCGVATKLAFVDPPNKLLSGTQTVEPTGHAWARGDTEASIASNCGRLNGPFVC